ncbi:VolA/Pla-1 family phospholipase [Aeromonas schubertii]|uniref:VolA/Pla-1 family phospholipase n=1 Tax=Aeromonas schubertii TaxID=652 RepID=UPI001CC82261|nr:VolA/Pla-1 family phospholipase [Aeromonas schubertii]MBZ6073707.1 lipase [Aeromonas schubertii]
MKKKLIFVAVATALLTACGGGDDNKGDTSSSLDYLLTGSTGLRASVLAPRDGDGTLKFSTETTDLSNPVSALSTLDGWSTTQPVTLVPIGVEGVSVPAPSGADFAAAVAPLYLFELDFDSSTMAPKGIKKQLVYGSDFVVAESGGKLALVPLKPFNPSSYYMTVATSTLKDSRGSALRAGDDYANLRANAGSSATEQKLHNLIALQEGLFLQKTGITSDKVIFSDWFATQSGADVLTAVKGAAASILANSATLDAAALWKQDASGNTSLPGTYTINQIDGGTAFLTKLAGETFLPQASRDQLAQVIGADPTLSGLAAATKVYSGTVRLPYFLSTPALAGSWDKAKGQSWHGAVDSLYAIANALKAGDKEVIDGLVGAGVNPAELAELLADPGRSAELLAEASKLIGVTLTSGGKPIDTQHNIGRFNPLPALSEVQSVPMRIFAAAPLSAVTDVIIYQHGVTSVKENAYALALSQIGAGLQALPSAKNVAIVVIDHPLHGERGYALSGSMDTVTTSSNPTPYLNLSYLTVARDNLKQSVADLLGLRLAVGLANSKGVIGGVGLKVHFLGHSLGAITGTNLLAVANAELNPQVDPLFKFDTGGLAMPGGGIAPLLLNSPTFGPTIQYGILTSSSAALKDGFTAYAPSCQKAPDPACFVNEFLPKQDAATRAAATSTLASYSFAAQSVLDSADPINLGAGIKSDLKLFATEIVGDGALKLPDQVIPNTIASAPLGGTEPLLKVLGLQPLTGTQAGPIRHVARFVDGGHSSLLAPDGGDDTGAVTAEIQKEFASFFVTAGGAVQVSDPNLLKQ